MKVTAVVGSYRKGGMIDVVVDEILASAHEAGAETKKFYLTDKYIKFCTNCRSCTQTEGSERGACTINDEMGPILDEIDQSDALVLASPMNFWTVTSVMKRFIERLICFSYWPWGSPAPRTRSKQRTKRAVLVASSAAPALLARVSTRMVGLMKTAAGLLGAKTVGVLFVGLSSMEKKPAMSARTKSKARRLGKKLVVGHRAKTTPSTPKAKAKPQP